MKKVVSLILVLVLCLSFACTAFAADEGFVESPSATEETCGHGTVTVVGQKDPTCTEEGYTGDKVCDDCGKVIEEGSVIEKTSHNYEDGKCTICGDEQADNPETGDTSAIGLWLLLMILAAVALVVVGYTYRRKFAKQ